MAAQDRSLFTRNRQSKIVKKGANPECHFCKQYDEIIDHLGLECPIDTPNEYQNRHDRVGQYLHWKICKHYNTPHSDKLHEHKTSPVAERENATILLTFLINTGIAIQVNRPGIVVKDYKSIESFLIDMKIPTDRKNSSKEFDKFSKYKDVLLNIWLTSSQEANILLPITSETLALMYKYQRIKHQKDRNTSRTGVLKLGIAHRNMQNRHLP